MKSTLLEKIKQLPPRFYIAMACYLVLIGVGLYIILPVRSQEDRFVLGFFLAMFTILAVKTIRNRDK